jgi:hypothetical protein
MTIGALVTEDAAAALAYARCQAKHSGVVAAYDELRAKLTQER